MFNKNSFNFILLLSVFIIFWKNIECCDVNPNSNMKMQTKDGNTTNIITNDNAATKFDDIDIQTVMNYCNESFRIKMDYLEELNSTGSFPDESDKTPMCFIRCYLENVGILTPDFTINNERAIKMLWSTSENSIDDCLKEIPDTQSVCEKAYFLAKCVMTRFLVDGRSVDGHQIPLSNIFISSEVNHENYKL